MPSHGNREVFARFQEEALDGVVYFYDSDVFDAKRADVIGDLRAASELASWSQEERRGAIWPHHVASVVGEGVTVAEEDVDGKQRLAAVFDACLGFLSQQESDDSAVDGDCDTPTVIVICTIAFGTNFDDLEMVSHLLSAHTGGTHSVSSLDGRGLSGVFGSLARRITTTRTSMTSPALQSLGSHRRDSFKKKVKMVAKRLLGTGHAAFQEMVPFCRNEGAAVGFGANVIKEAKLPWESLFFVACYPYSTSTYVERSYLSGGATLENDFNSSNSCASAEHASSEIVQAFSRHPFVKSNGRQSLADLQGGLGNGCMLLTGPQVFPRTTSKDSIWGLGDLSLEDVHVLNETHEGGEVCEKFGLLEKQQRSLQEETELNHKQCIICCDATRSTKFLPCQHSLACVDCTLMLLERFGKCPLCRGPIKSYEEGLFSTTYVRGKRDDKPPAERGRLHQHLYRQSPPLPPVEKPASLGGAALAAAGAAMDRRPPQDLQSPLLPQAAPRPSPAPTPAPKLAPKPPGRHPQRPELKMRPGSYAGGGR